MKKPNPKIVAGCGALTVFALGLISGVLLVVLLIAKVVPLSEGWKKKESKDFIANHFSKQLNLTDEQKVQLRPILDEFLDKRWELRKDYLNESRELAEKDYIPKAAEHLTPEQRKKANAILQRWWRDHRHKRD